MQTNPLTTAAEAHANAAPVPAFNVVVNDIHRRIRVRRQNMTYWLGELIEAEKSGDRTRIERAADTLAEFVMEARADADREGVV
jgi:hypothetical protein